VVLSDAEDVHPDLVGELDLFEEVPQALGDLFGTRRIPGDGVGGNLGEAVQAQFHPLSLSVEADSYDERQSLFIPEGEATPDC
jgi:hypothetical protein